MKRYGNLWETITDFDSLLHAHKQAKKGKSHYHEVQMVDSNPEYYIRWIQEELKNKTFTTSEYEVMDRWDGAKTYKQKGTFTLQLQKMFVNQ